MRWAESEEIIGTLRDGTKLRKAKRGVRCQSTGEDMKPCQSQADVVLDFGLGDTGAMPVCCECLEASKEYGAGVQLRCGEAK